MSDTLFATAFSLWGAPTTWLEVLAFALALGMVACNIRVIPGGWPRAAISSLLYGLLFARYRLYGEASLQVFFAAMAAWAQRPEVGAVGARLLYPDGTLQHAGVVLGLGEAAGHLYRGLPSDPAQAPRRSLVAQEVSAVTAACLVLRRADYLAVGGMNAEDFAVAYNDVDLCLKLAARGLKIVWTPAATLLHRESQSRGLPDTAAKIERQFREIRALRRRWLARLQADPQYNPNLSIYDDQSSLAWPPRLSRPWL